MHCYMSTMAVRACMHAGVVAGVCAHAWLACRPRLMQEHLQGERKCAATTGKLTHCLHASCALKH